MFLLFAPSALLHDLAFRRGVPWYQVAAWSVSTGLLAMAGAEMLGRAQRAFAIGILLLVLPVAIAWWTFWKFGAAPVRHYVEYFACVYMINFAYLILIGFIRNEGLTNLRQRTEIALAREVHEALVPPVRLETERLEILGSSEPATEVGGDLLDVVQADGTTAVFVADVTGHGVPAGVTMAMLKSAIRMRLRDRPPIAELLRDLNALMLDVLKPGVFATVAALRVDETGDVEFCLAGHPPLLHYRSRSHSIEAIESSAPPIGVMPGLDVSARRLRLEPGDLLVVLTDGLTEVFDEAGSDFGVERLAQAVVAVGEEALPAAHAALLARVRSYGPQTDDQTLLLLRAR
ncbi:MAG: PP2C family protein-serine/threonine phosphatase [Candidatus Eiseniibacteriota bacterium]